MWGYRVYHFGIIIYLTYTPRPHLQYKTQTSLVDCTPFAQTLNHLTWAIGNMLAGRPTVFIWLVCLAVEKMTNCTLGLEYMPEYSWPLTLVYTGIGPVNFKFWGSCNPPSEGLHFHLPELAQYCTDSTQTWTYVSLNISSFDWYMHRSTVLKMTTAFGELIARTVAGGRLAPPAICIGNACSVILKISLEHAPGLWHSVGYHSLGAALTEARLPELIVCVIDIHIHFFHPPPTSISWVITQLW